MKSSSVSTIQQTILVTLFLGLPLVAGGPLGSIGKGQFLKWDADQPVTYQIDPGTLGVTSAEAGTQLVRDAFARWNAVTTSRLTATDSGFIPVDVDSSNIQEFLNVPQEHTSIIFDADGGIIDLVLGDNASNNVLGFASPLFPDEENFYTYGIAVLNGTQSARPGFSQTVTHELGHLLGLDHTQVNNDQRSVNGARAFVPLMFPLALNGQGNVPLRDDIAWFSWLYPAPGVNMGSISGRVLRRSGLPIPGVHVVAVKLTGTGGNVFEALDDIVSSVSDFGVNGHGRFEIPGLPAGDYRLFIEPIQASFTGGSGVGPFDVRFTDFPRDYYNGPDESGDPGSDDPTLSIPLTIGAGTSIESIDMMTNNAGVLPDTLRLLRDDDSRIYEFPEGFSFPFNGRLYGFVYVNSDGNLTFVQDDSSSFARDTERMLTGPPRIAPLFTDLDPSRVGEISVESAPGSLRFRWEGVPEFVEAPEMAPPNDFSVTLFSTGSILFEYGQIAVTPDGFQQAIVGIVPGFLGTTAGESTDLSVATGLSASGVHFESFLGGSFDLSGMTIEFTAEEFDLFYPYYVADAGTFSAFAATNFSGNDVITTLESRDPDGTLSFQLIDIAGEQGIETRGLLVADNPHQESLAADQQFAKTGAEIFDVPVVTEQNAWVRLTAPTDQLASFFQFGNGLAGPLTQLDGGVAVSEQAMVLYFTRPLQGPFLFSDTESDVSTALHIANPNDVATMVEVTYFLPTGTEGVSNVMRSIPAEGVLRESMSSLLNSTDPISDGWIKVEVVSGPGAVGFASYQLDDSVFGLSAVTESQFETLYSAQLANGGTAPLFFFTNLKIVNTSNTPRFVTFTAVDENGGDFGIGTFSTLIVAGGTFQKSVGEIFSVGPATGNLTVGSLTVTADGPGVVGDVVFGDPLAAEFTAALLLQSRTFTKAIFSQVANGQTNPEDKSTDAFTGLAFSNPSETETITINVEVFDAQGVSAGSAMVELGPGERQSDLVENLVPGSSSLLGGYICVESTGPAVAQQLFGNSLLTFLSAVPPTIVQ